MDTYLVAYDISNPKRLRKGASTCEDFGLRRQFSSCFVVILTATDLVRLKSRLYEIIDCDMDQVIFVPLCARCSEQIEALWPANRTSRRKGCGDCELKDQGKWLPPPCSLPTRNLEQLVGANG